MAKLEITIDVIVHATEETSRFFDAFNEIFDLKEEEFSISNVTGHFENPITILRIKISKKPAKQFMEKFLRVLSKSQIIEIIQEIEERTENSYSNL